MHKPIIIDIRQGYKYDFSFHLADSMQLKLLLVTVVVIIFPMLINWLRTRFIELSDCLMMIYYNLV